MSFKVTFFCIAETAIYMKQAAKLGIELTAEERKRLFEAHKKLVGVRQSSLKSIHIVELNLDDTEQEKRKLAKDDRSKVSFKVFSKCCS